MAWRDHAENSGQNGFVLCFLFLLWQLGTVSDYVFLKARKTNGITGGTVLMSVSPRTILIRSITIGFNIIFRW
jgi:hypothetical protein